MADTSLAVSPFSPTFVRELTPAAEKIALLYYLSYLCLGKFSSLERTIRSRAVETQTLFTYSDATMMKCVLTSDNLVNTLFPLLVKTVEKNKPTLAVKFLGKAQVWITDIITDVKEIVKRYDAHNIDLATAASDVYQEKEETDKNIAKQDQELKGIKDALDSMKKLLDDKTKELAETEKKIISKSQEIQELVRSITQESKGLGVVAAIIPFIGQIIKSIYDAAKSPEQVAKLKALEAELKILSDEKSDLKQKQWQVQLQIINQQMLAAKASFDRNSIPDPIYLPEVQKSLTIIRDILGELLNFWLKVRDLLVSLEQKTFAGEDFLDEFDTFKDEFIDSIQKATEAWSSFAASCRSASVIFQLQTKDAYRFLEVSPSSLSKEQWQIQYTSVKEKLQKIDPTRNYTSPAIPATAIPATATPAISA